jgi:putative transposase
VVRSIRFHVSRTLTGMIVFLVEADEALLVFDDQGTLLIEHPWPAPGTKYVGSGKKRGRGPSFT